MYIFSINIFGIQISPSYYGLMYAISFIAGYYIMKKRGVINNSILNNNSVSFGLKGKIQNLIKLLFIDKNSKNKILDDFILYIFFGVILGGRVGYIIFYNFSYYLNNLSEIIKVWEGGMSFHGGVIGVIFAMFLFSKKYKISFLVIADELTAILPIGIGLVRIGNYLNKELLGFFPYNGFLAIKLNGNSYFPSTLIEALFEGLILFLILNIVYKNKKFNGQIGSLFLILYSIFRILIEIFLRTPDNQIGYILGFLTMGEILSLPMLIFGIYCYNLYKNKN